MDGLELQWINKPELGLATTFEAIFAFILERWRHKPPPKTRRRHLLPCRQSPLRFHGC